MIFNLYYLQTYTYLKCTINLSQAIGPIIIYPVVTLFQQYKICLKSAELVCMSFLVCVVFFEGNSPL